MLLVVVSRPLAAKEIVIAVGLSLAPYVISENGTGMEMDIVREALKQSHHTMQLRYPPLKQVPVLYQKGVVDAAMTVTSAFGLDACLTDTVIEYQNFAITRVKDNIDIKSIEDLSGKNIVAFQNATTYLGDAYKQAVASANYTEVDNQLLQVNLLFAGRTSVVIADKNIFIYYKNRAKGVNTSGALSFHPIFPASPYRVAFRDAEVCADFNKGLTSLKQSGRYQQIIDYYLQHSL